VDPVDVLVTVIIPVLNGAAVLFGQLSALAAQQFAGTWEVVIADNGSTDPSLLAVCTQFASTVSLTMVDAGDQRGGPHARNIGAAHARGRLLVFCDQDDVVKPGWLQALVDAAEHHEIVAGALDYQSLNRGIPLPEYWTRIPEQLGRKLGFLPTGATCNVLVHRDTFERLGGFAEDFDVSDDVDFFWRAQLAGIDVGYAPEAQVEYRLRPQPWARMKRRYAYAKDEVHLYRNFREQGMPRDSWPRVVKDWARNLGLLPAAAFSGRCRNTIAERFPYRVGRLVGSVRWHVLFL
jgi:GT2 family glycosyltransferase